MAVDPKVQKQKIAVGLIDAASHLTTAWVEITKYNQIFVKSGLTFATGDFDGSPLAYVDPTQMATLITNLNAFVTWMNTGGQGDLAFKAAPADPKTM
jgi:hypothetical protein